MRNHLLGEGEWREPRAWGNVMWGWGALLDHTQELKVRRLEWFGSAVQGQLGEELQSVKIAGLPRRRERGRELRMDADGVQKGPFSVPSPCPLANSPAAP